MITVSYLGDSREDPCSWKLPYRVTSGISVAALARLPPKRGILIQRQERAIQKN